VEQDLVWDPKTAGAAAKNADESAEHRNHRRPAQRNCVHTTDQQENLQGSVHFHLHESSPAKNTNTVNGLSRRIEKILRISSEKIEKEAAGSHAVSLHQW
jgi:hypothetical protein